MSSSVAQVDDFFSMAGKAYRYTGLELAKLYGGLFQYGNNTDLCGTGLPDLRPCTPAGLIDPDRPQPFSASIAPQVTPGSSVGKNGHCSGTHCLPSTKALAAVVVVAVILLATTAAGSLGVLVEVEPDLNRVGGAQSTGGRGRHGSEEHGVGGARTEEHGRLPVGRRPERPSGRRAASGAAREEGRESAVVHDSGGKDRGKRSQRFRK